METWQDAVLRDHEEIMSGRAPQDWGLPQADDSDEDEDHG